MTDEVTAVAGLRGERLVCYFNAVAVAESDRNVIFAGMGQAPVRGNTSHGAGLYKKPEITTQALHLFEPRVAH